MSESIVTPETDQEIEQEMPTLEELADLCRKRASTYAFLARLYRVEVDENLLAELKGMRFPAKTGNTKVDEGYRMIAKYLSNLKDDSITELAVDYVRVFIGHGMDAFSASYPYESVYTSEKRLLMQEARDEVLSIYRSCGIDKSDEWKESEDHIALELEFMQVLATRAADALGRGDEDTADTLLVTQRNFFEDHLGSWVPMLTLDMRKFAKTGFYTGLAVLTDGFLETDREFLSDILSQEEEDGE